MDLQGPNHFFSKNIFWNEFKNQFQDEEGNQGLLGKNPIASHAHA